MIDWCAYLELVDSLNEFIVLLADDAQSLKQLLQLVRRSRRRRRL